MAPENTKASFEAALQNKVGGIEFDVRTTKDRIVIVVHDEFFKNASVKLNVAQSDYITIQQAFPDVLTLAEALSFIDCRVSVIIEIKPHSYISPILKDIEHALRSGWREENIAVSSFSFSILQNIRRVLPDIRIIVNERWSSLRATRRAKRLQTNYITMNQRWLWGGFIRSMVHSGYELSAYTINNPALARRWEKLGLYAIITDYPDRFNTKM